MTVLSITAASVALASPGLITKEVVVGEAVTQGQVGYLKAADNKYWLADADAVATAAARGIFMTPAATDGSAIMATFGDINVGATLTVGEVYGVSVTAGGIEAISELASGDFPTILGIGITASKLRLQIYVSGIAKA